MKRLSIYILGALLLAFAMTLDILFPPHGSRRKK